MSQYKELVERQQLLLKAEEWAKGVKFMYGFDSNKTRHWYDDRKPEGNVFDIMYNDQRIERTLSSGEVVLIIGNQLSGDELILSYQEATHG